MIKSFKHKGIKKFYDSGSMRGINAQHAPRLRMQLAALDSAATIEDMNLPGYRLHQLRGDRQGISSVSVSVNGNWRLTFEFREGDVYVLNYEDYH